MSRAIKFRAWDKANREMVLWETSDEQEYMLMITFGELYLLEYSTYHQPDGIERDQWLPVDAEFMQFTGLYDKNGGKEVYEGDVIDTAGNMIGNQYETPTLLKDKTNLLIQGFGTKDWITTYLQAVDRGCYDA